MVYLYNDSSLKSLRKKLRNDMTKSEVVLWSKLQRGQLGVKFRRQFGVGRYILDFYAPTIRLNIEVDGITHEDPVKFKKDQQRDEWLKEREIITMRFNALDCFHKIQQVTDEISSKVVELIKTTKD